MNNYKKSSAPALDRGLTILELISERKGGIGFNDIADELGLPTSSVARFVKVLIRREYILKNERSGLYESGPILSQLSGHQTELEFIREASRGILKSLRDKTSNTALIVYWNTISLECLAKEMHEDSLAMQNVGEIRTDILNYPWSPLLFQHIDPSHQNAVLERYDNPRKLRIDLEKSWKQYQKSGYCHDTRSNIRRFAAPLFVKDTFRGAIALGGTIESMADSEIESMGEQLKTHAQLLNLKLNGGD